MGNRAGATPGRAESVSDIAKRYLGTDAAGRLSDLDLRSRIVAVEMEQRALQQTVRRAADEAKGNRGPSAATSIMKNVSMKVGQDRLELLVEIMGSQGLGWEGESYDAGELSTVRNWLSSKAHSIFGGSHEIQNNIITKRILGLPEMTQRQ
jgi:alkylation response protein AidB-like acyl-CoA dehydrogenase